MRVMRRFAVGVYGKWFPTLILGTDRILCHSLQPCCWVRKSMTSISSAEFKQALASTLRTQCICQSPRLLQLVPVTVLLKWLESQTLIRVRYDTIDSTIYSTMFFGYVNNVQILSLARCARSMKWNGDSADSAHALLFIPIHNVWLITQAYTYF